MYCQRCRTPLKADSLLDDLNPAAFDLLAGSTNSKEQQPSLAQIQNVHFPQERKERYERAARSNQSPLHKRTIPAPRDGNPGMSFIEITESQLVASEPTQKTSSTSNVPSKPGISSGKESSLSWAAQRHERLFSILSAHSDTDHPICSECSSMLLSALNAKLNTATRERDAYASFLKQLQQAAAKHKDDEASVKKELERLKAEEQEAFAELLRLEDEKKQLESDLADLEDEEKELEREEQRFWLSRNAFDEQEHAQRVDLEALRQKTAHDQKQYEKLQRTNVYNDTFFISHDGNFGTINGLRLGRLPNIVVEWAEINAAWGQTLLLLQTLAERLSFSFQGYRLRPLGSTSRIEKLEYPQQPPDASSASAARPTNQPVPARVTVLELFNGGPALNRVFQSRRFDQAMVAFLDCLSQLGKHVERTSTSTTRDSGRPGVWRTPSSATNTSNAQPMRLPYVIDGDKIWSRDRPDEAYSIRVGIGLSPDENFTKACKYVLTCCKYLLAHVSNLDSSRPSQS
ncbi:Vacuolar protein sorting-associated protein atg6 [Lithohypha guttulata]|uniref:Vacuolar protein sorting-associated protein atg6 n=1 Tax=Lithohypha guttulata TaxID=1690604 RepID=UPI002DE01E1A|nr:Vacuolar protein sorting-associated protein atg6 [Lithohypha guttulata]KAK5106206.1 Vacuolar protein sorting-associated protein atg6 [Lithohypha guttulata]